MDNFHIICIVGIGVFSFAALLNILSMFYRLYSSLYELNKHYKMINKKQKPLLSDLYLISTDNFSIWGFFTLFTLSLIFTYLYASLYVDQGMQLKPFGIIVIFSRWICLAIISGIAIFYIHFQVDLWEHNRTFQAQGLYAIFFGVFSMIFIIFATLTLSTSSKIFSMVSSLIAAIITVLLLIVPKNIFFESRFFYTSHRDYHPEHSIFKPIHYYGLARMIFIISYGLYYIANVIIWFFSESNEITSIGNLDLTNETLTYLIFDIAIIYLFTIISLILAFYNKPKIERKPAEKVL